MSVITITKMFNSSKILVFTLLVTLASTIKGDELQNPPEYETLTQLKSKDIHSAEDIIIYRCTAGRSRTGNVACASSNRKKWSSPHDVEMVLRCPENGSGNRISYAELKFAATSPNIRCVITDGDIGMNHIALTLNIWNTLKLDYSAKFYTN